MFSKKKFTKKESFFVLKSISTLLKANRSMTLLTAIDLNIKNLKIERVFLLC